METSFFTKAKKFLSSLSFESWVRLTTILANIGLIFTIIFTYFSFEKEIYNENQNFAVYLYKDYSDLVLSSDNRPYLDTAYTNHLDKISDDYKYFVGFVLFYSESIYNIMYENEAWLNTVKYMIEPHLKYIKSAKLIDKAYDSRFVEFYNNLIREYDARQTHIQEIK